MEDYEEDYEDLFPLDGKVSFLFHKEYVYTSLEGKEYRIFGTPYCKVFGSWAYMCEDEELERKFSKIPEGLDILLTHDVAYMYADQSLQDIGWGTEKHFGTTQLRDAILVKKPKLHLSGHIHSAIHDLVMIGDTKHYNVSYIDERYDPAYEPLYLNI